tara:strand:+ start:313 stop:912 length:600 start_codon:yes stop_codon:yes gene_type:complete
MIPIKKILSLFFLLFFLQTTVNAEDELSQFSIEGMSIGDSLLEYFSRNQIQDSLSRPTFYPKSNKFKVILFESQNKDLYDYLNITLKNNDNDFIIYALRGEKEMSIENCFNKKLDQINGIENILNYVDKSDYKSSYGDLYGNSVAHVTDYYLQDNSLIRIFCSDFDNTNDIVKKNLWNDSLEVSISSKEFSVFLKNDAY